MTIKQRKIAELRKTVPIITAREAYALQGARALLIDIREPGEIASGTPLNAKHISRSFLEFRIEDMADTRQTLLLICQAGERSLFSAESLMRMGYTNIYSVEGGFNAWKSDGLPWQIPKILSNEARQRYSRHLMMPEISEAGQLKLLDSRVLLIGTGGLGSPAALYLAAAGVGTIGLVDDDKVERSNLQRQIIHAESRIGMKKVDSAKLAINDLNPDVEVETYPIRLTPENAETLFLGYDIVIDGSDNIPTRYLVNDTCVKLEIPNVHGAIYKFDGQLSTFWPKHPCNPGPCYRCLYPEQAPKDMSPSCADAGVLGVLPGVIGLLQAIEAIKIVTGIGKPLVGKILQYNALEGQFFDYDINSRADCLCCGSNTGNSDLTLEYTDVSCCTTGLN